jgi:hypothetical protein
MIPLWTQEFRDPIPPPAGISREKGVLIFRDWKAFLTPSPSQKLGKRAGALRVSAEFSGGGLGAPDTPNLPASGRLPPISSQKTKPKPSPPRDMTGLPRFFLFKGSLWICF